jgi:amino acid transporter
VSTFVERLYGHTAALVATGMVLWIALASVFSVLLGYSRVPYSAALDGNFFPIFGRLHPTKHFPHVSLLALGALAFFFSVKLDLETSIAGILAVRLIVQFIGQAVGVMLLRKRLGTERLPFKMWLYPLPAILTMFGWAWLFWHTGAGAQVGLARDCHGRAGLFGVDEGHEAVAVCQGQAGAERSRGGLNRKSAGYISSLVF